MGAPVGDAWNRGAVKSPKKKRKKNLFQAFNIKFKKENNEEEKEEEEEGVGQSAIRSSAKNKTGPKWPMKSPDPSMVS